MPNWCNNEVTVTGEEDKVKEFKDYCYSEWFHGKCGNRYTSEIDPETRTRISIDNPTYCGEKEFKDTCEKKRWDFSFRSILPMPPELEHTSSPARIYDTQEEVDEFVEDYLKNHSSSIATQYATQYATGAMTREYSNNLKKMYGADNWYDWSYDNWGTKWDASEVYCQDDGWMVKYSFDTAWNPPEPICEFLRDKFPDVHISWFFRDDGVEMAGYL